MTSPHNRSALDAIETRALRMAAFHQAALHKGRRRSEDQPRLLTRLKTQRLLLHDAYLLFVRISEEEEQHSYAAEWLLDNYFVVQAAIRQIVQDLPEKYYRQLPRLEATRLAGLPRVYAIARELVFSQDARVDLEQVEIFVNAYQHVTPLSMGELWAIPIMLRYVLIEALTQAATRSLDIDTLDEGGSLDEINPAVQPDTIIANCITSLRAIAVNPWRDFFERTSLVERILNGDPTRVYSQMDFETRNLYRSVVERYSRDTRHNQVEIARQAVALARIAYSSDPTNAPRSHVGYYLIGGGRRKLEKAIGYRPEGIKKTRRWLEDHPTRAYLSAAGLATLLVSGSGLALAAISRATFWQAWLFFLLSLVPALALAVSVVNWAIMRVLPPRRLPRLDFTSSGGSAGRTPSSAKIATGHPAGIPAGSRSVVVIPALLTGPQEVDSLINQIELHYLRNHDPNLAFGLLTDFADAPQAVQPQDSPLLERAQTGIDQLIQRYNGDRRKAYFFLLHRDRRWNPAEGAWMGWERKRGKLEEFNRLLTGARDTSFAFRAGNLEVFLQQPGAVRYVITLDADTLLPAGGAAALIGALAHPLNTAQFDPASGRVTSGYTVLQPRTEIRPESAAQTHFAHLYSGDAGLDLYSLAVSDIYQDLWGEGIYVGKGIYDVNAFRRSTDGQIPENALLSHDLLEGLLGRAGLVSNVVLYESYPATYPAYMRRLHRWIRGDWQLLPWLLNIRRKGSPGAGSQGPAYRLSWIDRWKIIDNLRRSLYPITLLALLLSAWLWLPGSPLAWTVFAILTTLGPLLTGLLGQKLRPRETTLAQPVETASKLSQAQKNQIYRWLLSFVFLPHEALLSLSAILITLVRMLFTRRRLLEWTTSASVDRALFDTANGAYSTWREMAGSLVLSLGVLVVITLTHPGALAAAIPFILVWVTAPAFSAWLNEPILHQAQPLSQADKLRLRRLARRTWYFFERFVGPGDHWLPPDHFQETPRGQVAHRTSTTNIGLAMTATLAAHDLGYSGMAECLLRIHNILFTLDQLATFRGHYLNWYDTRTLQPLPPRYVSTVDNGNLAASMLALRQGLPELKDEPMLRWQCWEGLLDTFSVLREVLAQETVGDSNAPGGRKKTSIADLDGHLAGIGDQINAAQGQPETWPALLKRLLESTWPAFQRRLLDWIDARSAHLPPERLQSLRIWSDRIQFHLNSMDREQRDLIPWVSTRSNLPAQASSFEPGSPQHTALAAVLTLLAPTASPEHLVANADEIQEALERLRHLLLEQTAAGGSQALLDWCSQINEDFNRSLKATREHLQEIQRICDWLDHNISGTDFRFLYDSQRRIFHIGYNVDAERMDANYYDLLASESRIASLIAIAKGDVPQRHWLQLGRPMNIIENNPVLLSWSGTMFEYLMPPLLLREYPNTLLNQSAHTAVRAQIGYADGKMPWGTSESGFYYFDANQNYQYRAFGVPGLGFKRGLADDLVVTPYACLLALPFAPQEVLDNLQRLDRLNMLGDYGYYEAIDFTLARLPLGQQSARISSFMAHHQGMILLALANQIQGNRFVNRFHANPAIQSVDLLLQEQMPKEMVVEQLSEEDESPPMLPVEGNVAVAPWAVPVENTPPRVHYLSNGHYSLLITNHGSGYSAWQGQTDSDPRALTRWRADSTQDDWGNWLYLQDLDAIPEDAPALWTIGAQLLPLPGGTNVFFSPYKADFHNNLHELNLHLQVTVHPEDDLEVRLLNLTNSSDRPRRVALTSYGEVALASLDADRRHPAFQKLVVESEYEPDANALVFHRRPRSPDESPIYLLHSLVFEPGRPGSLSYESDRARFIGRGRTARAPQALQAGGPGLAGSTGPVLDPIFALRGELTLPPHSRTQIAFATAAGSSRQALLALGRRLLDWSQIERAFDQARYAGEVEVRRLLATNHVAGAQDLETYQALLSTLIYPQPALRASPELLANNTLGQPGLWAYSISGDYPILLLKITEREELAILREVLPAHTFWRNRGLRIDLVILTEKQSGYGQEVHDRVLQTLLHAGHGDWLNRRGGIFLVRRDQLGGDALALLHAAARAVLSSEGGPLAGQLHALEQPPIQLPRFVPVTAGSTGDEVTPALPRPAQLAYDNGLGGFRPDGQEYQVYLTPGSLPPAPWINVIANEQAGFWVSETGGGYTWAANSGENRLTPWRNDPLSDQPGEALYLRDEETAAIWSPTPLPAGEDLPYLVRHTPGSTTFEHHSHGLRQVLRLAMAPDHSVKIIHLRLENLWQRERRITATYYVEWVLGVNRDQMQQYILPEYEQAQRALLARNPYNVEFGQRVAFLAASQDPHGLTTDRREFVGLNGDLRTPAGLQRVGLSGNVEPGGDPCAALQVHIDLPPGGSAEVYFLLGQGATHAETLDCLAQLSDLEQVHTALNRSSAFWRDLLGTLKVETPDPSLDILLNTWLLYQDLACRIWGRSALYQSGGAFGFRDQLQDVMALLLADPHLARSHILQSAQRQFVEGDVLHWWHPPSGRGVRTRISDDLLWLPYVTAEYVSVTGDTAILGECIPFLVADPLKPDEEDRYGEYPATADAYSLYEHCLRAIRRASTTGPHGLPLFGTGDWNDGMNRVGANGAGESVWLGWFLYDVLQRFIPICRSQNDPEQAGAFEAQALQLQSDLRAHAWDGDWYLRGFYDSGQALGSSKSDECQIDSLAQSWAVLSGAGEPERNRQAMQAVLDRLRQEDGRLLRLFTPPFDQTQHDPGYIKAYPPGVRENGGQYTHAALWSVWAFAHLGQGNTAMQLFDLLNPIHHAASAKDVVNYRVEPYVIAADVYSEPPHVGRGGWTWYTGSAGWMYRLGIEAILGLRRRGNRLLVDPCIPDTWSGYTLHWRFGSALYTIRVENPHHVQCGVQSLTLDGQNQPDLTAPLADDGQSHQVVVLLGPAGAHPLPPSLPY